MAVAAQRPPRSMASNAACLLRVSATGLHEYLCLDAVHADLLDGARSHAEEGAEKVEFAVEFDHRASDKLDRMAVIDAVIAPIKQPPHKVNLKAPSKTILVQLVRGMCACSVVERFKELSRFNVVKVAEPPEEKAAAEGAGGGVVKKDD